MAQKANANVFSDGLSQDFFHTNEKNTTLSDALNATLISRNGNELSLQNDMGNTKLIYREKRKNTKGEIEYIDNEVKLPQNFIPVGMKEYGGIVYILSTSVPENPNEEKLFQIGSFPGPQFSIPEETQLPDTEIATIVPDTEIDEVEPLDEQLKREAINESLNKAYNLLPHVESDNSTKYVFRACDAFKMTLFGLDFDTITEPGLKDNERKLYTYKIINTYASGSDITDAMQKQGFHLGINQYHSTWKLNDNMTIRVYKNGEGWLDVLKDSLVQDLADNVLANTLGIYSCIHYGYGEYDDELTKYFSLYSSSPVDKIIVYTGNSQLSFTDDDLQLKHKKDLENKEFVYYPNIKKGNLSIQFQLEKVDAFQLCRINQNNIEYTFDLLCTGIMEISKSVKEQIKTFLEKMFLCDLKYSNNNVTVNYWDGSNNKPLKLDATYNKDSNGVETITIPFYGKSKNEEGQEKPYKFCDVKITLGELRDYNYILYSFDNDDSLSKVLNFKNIPQYYLSLPNLLIKQPSWVKINELEVSYELVDNDDKKTIRSRTYRSKVENKTIAETSFDEALVNDEKDNIYASPIQDVTISKKDIYLFVRGTVDSSPTPITLDCISIKKNVEDGNTKYCILKETDTSKGITVAQPIYNDDKNVTLKLKVRPINTDYNIDLDYLTFERTIDFSKSKDQWLGTCEYKKSNLTVQEDFSNFNKELNVYRDYLIDIYSLDSNKTTTDYFIDNRVNVNSNKSNGNFYTHSKLIARLREKGHTFNVLPTKNNYENNTNKPFSILIGTFSFQISKEKHGSSEKDLITYASNNIPYIPYTQSKSYNPTINGNFKVKGYNIIIPGFWNLYNTNNPYYNLVPSYTYIVPSETDISNKLKNLWITNESYRPYISEIKANIQLNKANLGFMYGPESAESDANYGVTRWIRFLIDDKIVNKDSNIDDNNVEIIKINSQSLNPGAKLNLRWYMTHHLGLYYYWIGLLLNNRITDNIHDANSNLNNIVESTPGDISPLSITYSYADITINKPNINTTNYNLGNLYVIKQDDSKYLRCNIKYDVLYNDVNKILEKAKYSLNDDDYSIPFTNHYENLIKNYATEKKVSELIRRLTTDTNEITKRNSFPATYSGDNTLFHRYERKGGEKIKFTATGVTVNEYYIVAFYTSVRQDKGIKVSTTSQNVKEIYIPKYKEDNENEEFKYSDDVMIAQKVSNPSSFTYKLPESLDKCIFLRYVMLVIPSATKFDITLEFTDKTIIHNPIYYNVACDDLTTDSQHGDTKNDQIGLYKYKDNNITQLLVSDFNVQGLQINSELTKTDTYKYFDDTYERNFVPLPFFDIENTAQIK